MIKYYFVFITLLFSIDTIAQEEMSDMQLVIKTVENYFSGYVERDIEKLNEAFDTENGIMKILSKTAEGKEISQNNYFKNIIPRWSTKKHLSPEEKRGCKLKFLNLEIIQGKLAISTIEMKIGETVYLDVLSLQKINSVWKITNKMFVVKKDTSG